MYRLKRNMYRLKGLAMIVGFSILCVQGIDWYTEYQCSNFERYTNKKVIYASFDSCYIHHDGRFMRWSEYKAFITANGLTE